jgi:hypothetical protein
MRLTSSAVLATVTLVIVTAFPGAAGAATPCEQCTPWWHLTTYSRPTNLWTPKSEAQEIDDTATEGKFALFVTEPSFKLAGILPYNASAKEVEEALQNVYGAGNVEVTGGPGGEKPFIVTAINPDAGAWMPQPEIKVALNEHVKAEVTSEGGSGEIVVHTINIGDAPVNGEASPVTITDKLPEGLTAYHVEAVAGQNESHSRGPVQCTQPAGPCTFAGQLPPYESIEVIVHVGVTAKPPVSGEPGAATVTGGTTPSVSIQQPATVGETTPFGVHTYELMPEQEGGVIDTQAGSHPFQLSTTLVLNQGELPALNEERLKRQAYGRQPGLPRNAAFKLPAGLVGNATITPQCTESQFTKGTLSHDNCPADTAVGAASVTIFNLGISDLAVPLFNLQPAPGEPARFGFYVADVPIVLDTSVRAGEEYGVTVTIKDISQTVLFLASTVSFWGVPSAPQHNESRGWACIFPAEQREELEKEGLEGACRAPEHPQQSPLLRLPTSCAGALAFPMELESWTGVNPTVPQVAAGALDGCNRIPFGPELKVESSTQAADSPTELKVHLKVPQEASDAPNGVAESDVKNTTVTLPAGLQINPAAAGGLEACAEADVGFDHVNAQTGEDVFFEGESHCPRASKLGTVKITTPLLADPLEGDVYQAAQGANPFGSLLAIYVIAEDKNAGVRVKLAGKVSPNPSTGQLVSTFNETPQLPFDEFSLDLFGGNKAALATSACGSYRTETSIEPWSGAPAASPFSEFEVTTGPSGTPCQTPQSFSPAFVAGTTNNQGGAFSPFTLTLSRADAEQTFSTVATEMPRGLAGMLSNVALCDEAQANVGFCPATSQIGHVTVSAGVGNEPITLPQAAKPQDPVYLTGPYKGAPFGLSIVVPAEAGPFDLGSVVVRARIVVDPHTAQVSVISDPLPTMLQGIPVDVRTVNVAIDRAGFIFNPTNCDAMQVTGTVTSTQGTAANVSSRFQAANCATLPFKPTFTVLTQAKTSKADGAYLHVKVVSGAGQANIAKVKVDLPVRLPSRLSTLQKACLAAVFESNPASCPAASVVGTATAVTPVLKNALTGPAYLVSHGNVAFPDLEIMLQGEGITLVLDGNTDIKKGITSSTFRAIPDAPISTFDLVLPEGPHSVLAAYLPVKAKGSMCGQSLSMPTAITGQNGAVMKQTTKIAVSGCPKHKKTKKKAKKGRKASAKHRKGRKK